MSKRTPGPWSPDPEGEHWTSVQSDATGEVVCDVHHEQHDDSCLPEEGWANARLIAAAPDMLAALERALNERIGRLGIVDPADDPLCVDLSHVIAKAGGEE